VKNGFARKIYCTPATAEIAELILLDSANIQKHDCEYYNSHLAGKSRSRRFTPKKMRDG